MNGCCTAYVKSTLYKAECTAIFGKAKASVCLSEGIYNRSKKVQHKFSNYFQIKYSDSNTTAKKITPDGRLQIKKLWVKREMTLNDCARYT